MKIPFRRTDPAACLKATEAALAEAEGRIHSLGEQRAAKLLESDGVDEVAGLDRQIAAERVTAGIHQDRIGALHAEIRRQAQLAADRERADRVAATEKALRDRDAIAVKLETAIADMGRLYFELVDQNQIIARQWGMSHNALRVGLLGERLLGNEVSHAMFAAGRPRNGACRLPAPGNAGLGMVGDSGGGTLAQRIALASDALLEMVRAVSTPINENEAA